MTNIFYVLEPSSKTGNDFMAYPGLMRLWSVSNSLAGIWLFYPAKYGPTGIFVLVAYYNNLSKDYHPLFTKENKERETLGCLCLPMDHAPIQSRWYCLSKQWA